MTPTGLESPWPSDRLDDHLERLTQRWRRDDGMLATVYRGDACIDPTPLVADLGDFAAFLTEFDRLDIALEQAARARPFLWRGLFEQDGRVRLFENHDYLLGLIDLYQATRDSDLLEEIHAAIDTLVECFEHKGMLLDEYRPGARRRPLAFANPFNGGYIEGLVDLYELTGERHLLLTASRWARAWIQTPYFREYGLFSRFNSPSWPWAGYMSSRLSRHGPVRLFKDNTNMVWSLAALQRVEPHHEIAEALGWFLDGYERILWNGGRVRQAVDDDGATFRLIPAAFSLDLLCDLAALEIQPGRCLNMAEAIAAECLDRQWESGAFPVADDQPRDHLDVSTDAAVALWKLWELTDDPAYAEAAHRSWCSIQSTHWTPHGLTLSVDPAGDPVDDRIIVKYQSLALKSAVLWRASDSIYADHDLWSVLRDR